MLYLCYKYIHQQQQVINNCNLLHQLRYQYQWEVSEYNSQDCSHLGNEPSYSCCPYGK